MKKLFVIAAFVFAAMGVEASAQSMKRVENNFQVGAGVCKTDDDGMHGISLSATYGLDLYFTPGFSIMPSLGVRAESESMIRSGFGDVDLNDFIFADFAVSARFHLMWGATGVNFGIGPCFSYTIDPDKYLDSSKYDDETSTTLGGKEKIDTYDLALMPSVTFDFSKHFGLGAKANIGMRDVSRKYPAISEVNSRHINSVEAILYIKF